MKDTQVVGMFSTPGVRISGTAVACVPPDNSPHIACRNSFGTSFSMLGLELAALVLVFLILLSPQNSNAQDGTGYGVMRLGDVAVSGFSGIKLQTEGLPLGIDPVSKTVIDPDGTSLRILDASLIAVPFAGQQLDPPLRTGFKAHDIGQVFSLAFDNLPLDERGSPGLYAGATSAFGLHITGPDQDGDGLPDRLSTGAVDASFMEGQFGTTNGGGPGAIWKIDAATGTLGLYAELASVGVTNSGPGIGGLAFDPVSRSLYASDLDTGLIHQFKGAATGSEITQYDHGLQGRLLNGKTEVVDDGLRLDIKSGSFSTASPLTWGFTQVERRVDGLAVHDGRLYYAVAEGPEIWSVGLSEDGEFLQDARMEVRIATPQPGTVTAIDFDTSGYMIAAVRNAVQNNGDYSAFVISGPADVIRFSQESPDDPQTTSIWSPEIQTYHVGQSAERRDASGGLALQYSYRPDGSLDTASCQGTLLASGDVLGPQLPLHGVQIGAADQFGPGSGLPFAAAFTALDPSQDSGDARGHAGGIAVMAPCVGETGFPQVAADQPGFPGVVDAGGALPGIEQGTGFGENDAPAFPDLLGGGGGKKGKLSLVKLGAVPKCSPNGGCAFNVEVRNDGAAVAGPIVITELIEAPQAALTGEPNAPWKCSKVAPFVCTHPGPVPANGKLDMRVVFAPNLPLETKEVRNCASLADTPKPLPGKVGVGVPTPPVRASQNMDNGKGLKSTIVATPQTCRATEACGWDVTLTNSGAAPIAGELQFDVSFSFSDDNLGTLANPAKTEIVSSSLPPGAVCQVIAQQLSCKNPGMSLAPNASATFSFKLGLTPPPGKPNSAVSTVQANSSIQLGKLSSKIGEPLPDPASAQSMTFSQFDAGGAVALPPADPAAGPPGPVAAAEPRCATIPLDPNAPVQSGPIFVTKKGASKCTAKGPCTFSIAIQNTTNAPINGPIVIDEQIDAPQAAPVGEPNAPWTCNKAAPFTCSHPGPLLPDATIDLTLSFIPNLPVQIKQLKNCAVVRNPPSAPQKKAELLRDVLPQLRPVLPGLQPEGKHRASSKPPFNQGLLHLTSGVENIDIPADRRCLTWDIAPRFSLEQGSKGEILIIFSNVSVEANGTVRGTAKIWNSDVTGTISVGHFDGTKMIVQVDWLNGSQGYYTAEVNPGGFFNGETRDLRGGAAVEVNSKSKVRCARDVFCDAYATRAAKLAKDFAINQCGPDKDRWSTNFEHHSNWCMAQPRTKDSTAIASEAAARDAEMAVCNEKVNACTDFGRRGAVISADFKAHQCEDGPPIVTLDGPGLQAMCMRDTNYNQFIASAELAQRQRLDTCIALSDGCAKFETQAKPKVEEFKRLKCDELPLGGALLNADLHARCMEAGVEKISETLDIFMNVCKAQQANANDGAGGGAQADKVAEPTPEQCAVVPIDHETPPGEKPVADGGVPGGGDGKGGNGKPAKTANGLEITKTATAPQSCAVGKPCMFNVTVKNTIAADIPGPVEVVDTPTGIGGELKFSFDDIGVSPPAPWQCTKGTQPTCTHPGPVPAGGALVMTIGITPRAGTTATVMRNCAGPKGADAQPAESCATATILSAPQPPPTLPNNLVLAKNPEVEQCSDLGGGCAFRISITNPGPGEFVGPLKFTDTVTTADGQSLFSVALDNDPAVILPEGGVAPISCRRSANGFDCDTGVVPARIPAGKTIQVLMSMKPGAAAGSTAIKNCVSIEGVAEKPCATIPFVNGPLLRAQKISAANTCVPTCAFAINLRNIGNADAIGPFVLQDKFTQETTNLKFEEIDGAFNCGKANNGSLVCISPTNVLRPGEVITGRIKIDGAAPAPEYTNCLDYNPAANGTPSAFDKAFPGRCITIKDTAPKRPNLVIKKQAPNAEGAGEGHCDLKNSCRFQITVTNNGTGDYVGPLEITDSVSLGVPQFISIGPGSSPAFKWECTRAQNGAGGFAAFTSISCKLPSLTMAPGTSVPLEVAVTAGTTWKGSNKLQNCAEIVRTADFGDSAPDKKSCASVKLDPFAVKVTKTGDQTCEPGSDCHFRISLFNQGPIDHVAPVTITDQLTGLSSAQIVSITPASAADPFPCVPAPTQIPFTCTSPGDYPLMLGPDGEPGPAKIFDMVVRLPNDASAGQFSNCATASDDSGQASEQSCATVTTLPAMRLKPIAKTAVSASCNETDPCEFKVTITNTLGQVMPGPIVIYDLTTIGGVPSTQIALKGGAAAPWACVASAAPGLQCSYPGPLAVNASVDLTLVLQPLPGSLDTATEVENCATLQGIRPGFATDCATIPVKIAIPKAPAACFSGMVLTNGICVCPGGTKWNGKICDGTGGINMSAPIPDTPRPVNAKVCPADRPLGTYPNCCPRGTLFSKGKCALLTTKPVVCGNNQVLDKATNKCVALKAKPVVCGNNQVLDKKTNKCVRRKKPAQVCPADRPIGTYPNCCPQGTEFRNGKCRPPQQQQEKFCGGDRPNGVYPNCCPDGYQYARGKCRRIQREQQPDTNDGQAPNTKTCPDGSVVYGQYTQCPDDKPVLRDCGEGYITRTTPNKYGNYCDAIPQPGAEPPTQTPPPPECGGNKEMVDGQCIDRVN